MTKHIIQRAILVFVVHMLAVFSAAAAGLVEIDQEALKAEIGERQVSFLARDLETGTEYVLSGSDITARHTPWSTFKIPNLIIALETGIAASVDAEREWDTARRPAARFWPKSWRQDQTLRTAFQRSAVWYFRDIAEEVGAGAYRSILGRWGYGNAEVADGSDNFWLNGTLKISVQEQVDFLEHLIVGRLDVDAQHIDALRLVSRAGEKQGISLHGKTGSGPKVSGNLGDRFEGWYVGFVDRPNAKPIVFALYVEARSFRDLRDFRRDFAVDLLEYAGLLPKSFLD